MLSQIVTPLVDTQIRRLANSQATYSTLVETIAKWLSYLGVKAKVTHLTHKSEQIQISLTVEKPHTCASNDWQKILNNLDRQESVASANFYTKITQLQRKKIQRLFAYLIQISQPEKQNSQNALSNLLYGLNLDEFMILGIRSAIKVPQSIDRLLNEIEPTVMSLVLPEAMKIVLSENKLSLEAETAIIAMLQIAKSNTGKGN